MFYVSSTVYVFAAVLAVVATVLAFIFIVPEKKRAGLNKFGKFLHDTLCFKYLIIEKILQALYICSTAFIIIYGFFLLFQTEKHYYYYGSSSSSKWLGGYGLLLMIFGPIAIRLTYELLMLAILLVKNVIGINNKLKNQNDDDNGSQSPFAAPDISGFKASQQPVANVQASVPAGYVICPNCGATVQAGTFCTKCGTKV